MKGIEIKTISRLSPGFYAFCDNKRVVTLEFIEHADRPYRSEVRFNMARLGTDEQKEIVANEGASGMGIVDALQGLKREHREIISRFAQETCLKENDMQQVGKVA